MSVSSLQRLPPRNPLCSPAAPRSPPGSCPQVEEGAFVKENFDELCWTLTAKKNYKPDRNGNSVVSHQDAFKLWCLFNFLSEDKYPLVMVPDEVGPASPLTPSSSSQGSACCWSPVWGGHIPLSLPGMSHHILQDVALQGVRENRPGVGGGGCLPWAPLAMPREKGVTWEQLGGSLQNAESFHI